MCDSIFSCSGRLMVAVLSDPGSGYLTMVTGHWSNTLLLDHHQDIHHSARHELVQEQFVGTTEIGQKDRHRSIFSPLCRHVSYVRLLIDTWCYNSLLCLLNTKAGQNLSRILQYRYVRFGQGGQGLVRCVLMADTVVRHCPSPITVFVLAKYLV